MDYQDYEREEIIDAGRGHLLDDYSPLLDDDFWNERRMQKLLEEDDNATG